MPGWVYGIIGNRPFSRILFRSPAAYSGVRDKKPLALTEALPHIIHVATRRQKGKTTMATDAIGRSDPPRAMSVKDLQSLMSRPNGTTIVLELVRDGRVSAVDAARVIDDSRAGFLPRVKAFLMALAGLLGVR